MSLGILGAIADSPLIADLLAGAGLGSLVGFAVAERMRRRGLRDVELHSLGRRWALAGAVLVVLFDLGRGLT